jgi:tetrahydromethanopterin S-methyltransferase subunit H
MWKFKAEQKRFEIGKVKIGGIPGERPTVLVGTIFYNKHKIVTDQNKGEFDREKAESCVKTQEEFSDKTGNPHMLDVVGASPEAMKKYLEFVSSVTDAPVLMDGVSADIRIAGLDYVKEVGLKNPIIYNSILPDYKQAEIDKIKETKTRNVLLLAFNMKEFTSTGRVKAIKNLIPIVTSAGADQLLFDTTVIDIPSLGMASKALWELKDELGYPVGCGAHNAIGTWKGLKKKMGSQAHDSSMAVAAGITAALGADFVLYGPIEAASYMFPSIALIDAAYGQLIMEQGRMLDRSHPIFRIA